MIRISEFSVETPVGTWPDLAKPPCYEAPGELHFKIGITQRLTLGEWGCPPR